MVEYTNGDTICYCELRVAYRGPHLLPIALKYSTLANELRILFHNLVGMVLSSCTFLWYWVAKQTCTLLFLLDILYRGALCMHRSEWAEGDEHPTGLQGGEAVLRQHVHNADQFGQRWLRVWK